MEYYAARRNHDPPSTLPESFEMAFDTGFVSDGEAETVGELRGSYRNENDDGQATGVSAASMERPARIVHRRAVDVT